ncbi:hypothetical protein [Cumulibacter soli]|uniref:hypothetical protein n=1 Tax=Cumulibacter soli TaxID=2546344 RepID=UPI001067E352|nr:hypothetical protein [Cumulibacter soli]
MTSTLARRTATAVLCAAGVLGVAGCVTTLPGTAGHAPGTVVSPPSESAKADGLTEEAQQQCADALTSAKGFIESWKDVATGSAPPTAEQRQELAKEVQGYVDELNAQMPTISDDGLVSHVQQIVSEMNSIVIGLQSGIAVELSAYSAAVNSTTEYCK